VSGNSQPGGGAPVVVPADLADVETLSQEIFPGYFRIHVEHAFAEGVVHTTPGRAGVALWLPTGLRPVGPSPGYDARLLAATSPHGHHPTGTPHHHLAILAVRPDCQGQGIGTALLRAHHAVLDEAGLPAYLEASDLRTRRLYAALGYGDHGLPIHLARGSLMFPMWRNPQTGLRPAVTMKGGSCGE